MPATAAARDKKRVPPQYTTRSNSTPATLPTAQPLPEHRRSFRRGEQAARIHPAAAILAELTGILYVVFALLLPKFERIAMPPADILSAATAAGRLAPARELSARGTGMRVGANWEFATDLDPVKAKEAVGELVESMVS